MNTDSNINTLHQGTLTQARLYGGSFDNDHTLRLHSFDSPCGSIAIGIALGPGKGGPNEDAAALVPLAGDGLVLMIADGVGGLPTGWKASGLVLGTLRSELDSVIDDDAHVRTAILDGIEQANSSLLQFGTGTATTLVVAEVRANQVRTFHIGDSAAWVCGQRGVMKLRTTPHSPVGFAVESGLMQAHEALGHAELNVISNVVGSNDMRIEIGSRYQLAPRDTLLIASDGLFDNLLESEIVDIIRTGSVAENIRELWRLTSRRMAGTEQGKPSKPDDFSAILFRPVLPTSG